MNLTHLKTSAKLRLQQTSNSPYRAALCTFGIIYGVLFLLQVAEYLLGKKEFSGISGAMLAANIQNLIIAVAYCVQILSSVFTDCFTGYARDLYLGKNNGFRGVIGYFRRGFPIFGVRILRTLFQVLWTVLFTFPAILYMSSSLLKYVPELVSLNPALMSPDEYDLFLQQTLLTFAGNCPIGEMILIALLYAGAFIGGFIMSYRYRLALYFVLDPNFRARGAVQASKYVLRGHKFELFRLDLSLIYYHILAIIPSAVLLLFNNFLTLADEAYFILTLCGFLWMIAVETSLRPYTDTVYAAFADAVINSFEKHSAEPALPEASADLK